MTVVLLICVVPHVGVPFVMVSADSRSTDDAGITLEDDAKKIFDAGNALMSTSGNGDDEYREDLARVLRELPIRTIEEKMNALRAMFFEDKMNHDWLQLNAGLVQFDEVGNPQMGICGIGSEVDFPVVGPYTYDKNHPDFDFKYMGETVTDEVARLIDKLGKQLQVYFDSGEINETSVENTAEWFIRKVAEVYPATVNGEVQTKTLSFK
ncbi:hypothetical protein [Sporosarcina sp. FSL K6-3457]|uniref:hypothetical protein n=1 Tax=Sporosarcina sp. FSL K6-3457 TaxID=2978204 RepID=UPI0030F8C454